jgi:phage terminase large subunit-like protein
MLPSQRFELFTRTFLQHLKGELAGQPLALDDWQLEKIVRPIFDNLDADEKRVVKEAFLFLPRKNGKTTLIVAICLYLLFCDPEPSPEIVSAAADREQASVSFDIAAQMIRKSPALDAKCRVIDSKKTIVHKKGGVWKVVAGDAEGNLGGNLSAVLFDELLSQRNPKLFNALRTGVGARSQPLFMAISTAGTSKESLVYERYDYAKKVQTGIVENPSFLPIIFEADEKDDPILEATWAKANPGLGKTIRLEYFQRMALEAKDSAASLASFRQFHLNQWIGGGVKWLPADKWRACQGLIPHEGRPKVWLGLDMSRRIDLVGLALAQPMGEKIGLKAFAWTNDGARQTRHKANKFSFDRWVKDGHLFCCPGYEVDYDTVFDFIIKLKESYLIQGIGADPYNAGEMIQRLEKAGLKVIEFRQRFLDMNQPTKDFELDVLSGRIVHEGNPMLAWSFDNVHLLRDNEGNIRPSKKHSSEAIDPAVASIMARALSKAKRGTSVYDTRPIRELG